METLWREIRQTLRWMARQKGFTGAACLTLALGIGATTASFSVVYGVLLKPLPYPDPDRLVRVWEEHPGADAPFPGTYLSDRTLASWTSALRTLEGLAVYDEEVFTVEGERLPGSSISPSLFQLLRVKPAVGRFFNPEEAVEGAADVVVVSDRLWRSRFGGSPDAVGRSLLVEGRPCFIVGVAPPGFAFPTPETVLWRPYVIPGTAGPQNDNLRVFQALGRLPPGASPSQAATEGTAAARAVPRPLVADLMFGKGGPVEVRVQPFLEQVTAPVRPALLVLAAAVGLVLLIACANVSHLFLARSITRRRELAVRAALGASRGRLAGQLLTESLVLALCGGLLGLLLAWGLTRAIPALAPDNLPRIQEIRLDGRVLAFAGAVSLVAGVLAGLVPAWRVLRRGPELTLQEEGGTRATGGAGRGLRSSLLVVEAALAVVLLVGAGLLVRSFARLVEVDGGFEPDHVLTTQIYVPDPSREPAQNAALLAALLARLKALPGVVAAGAANMAPLSGSTAMVGFDLPPTAPGGKPAFVRTNLWVVTPDYGRALGLRIRTGRFLESADAHNGTRALVVNEEFARLYLKDGRPVVGRRIPGLFDDAGTGGQVTEIVGVVANVLMDGPGQAPKPEIFVAAREQGERRLRRPFVLVRTVGDPRSLAPELRRLVREIEPRAALDGVDLLTHRLSAAVAQPRFAAAVLTAFSALALVLAATGLYGVLTYNLSQRRREMGIRVALGATRAGILRLVLREGLAITAAGLVLGIGAAWGVTRVMRSLLFGVTPTDPASFVIAPLALLAVALIACLLPARRASVVDPAEVLRSE